VGAGGRSTVRGRGVGMGDEAAVVQGTSGVGRHDEVRRKGRRPKTQKRIQKWRRREGKGGGMS